MNNIYAALNEQGNAAKTVPVGNAQQTNVADFVNNKKKAPDTPPHSRSAEEQALIDLIHSGDARECFGGYLFHRLGEYGWPVISFAVEAMTAEEIQEARKHYMRFNAQGTEGFLKFCENVQSLGRYTVFNFYVPNGSRTLRQCIADNDLRLEPETMMCKLVRLLAHYQDSLTRAKLSFYPLNCLSLDTILIDSQYRVFVVPLLPHKGRYPIEIPREVSVGNGGNIKSDLYSAAMVSVEFYSKGTEFEVELVQPSSPVLLSCLQTVNGWRPGIREVWNALNAKGNAAAGKADNRPLEDADGNNYGSHPSTANAVNGIRNIVSNAVSKAKKIRFPSFEGAESQLERDGTLRPQSSSPIIGVDSSDDTADVEPGGNFVNEV